MNPCLRAAYLAHLTSCQVACEAGFLRCKTGRCSLSLQLQAAVPMLGLRALPSAKVTLAVPWLSSHEQAGLFPDSLMFHRPDEQEAYIKKVRAGQAFSMRRSNV